MLLLNSDGTLNWALNYSGTSTFDNPLSYMKKTYDAKTYNLVNSASISYKLLPV